MLVIPMPTHIIKYRTTDDKLHHSSESAVAHEGYLSVAKMLPKGADYQTVLNILHRFDLVPK